MTIKGIFHSCAIILAATTCSYAADTVIMPEPEAVEYVRVCDAYGAGYFYIPGTETCLRIGGYVRYQVAIGDDPYTGERLGFTDDDGEFRKTWDKLARFTLRTYTASETELGTLKTFTENRFNFSNGVQAAHTLNFAYMQLGGLRIGLDESAFHTFTGYLGDVINDDVVSAGFYRTNLISYTFAASSGFSAILSLEQGGDRGQSNYYNEAARRWMWRNIDNRINSYMPHIVAGLKFEQGWGGIAGSAAYDSNLREWAAKVRLDINMTDALSVWVQGGYASYEENEGMYGSWGGRWAVWGGAKLKATDSATFNLQAAYEDWGKTAIAANVAYELVPGFTITPEFNYTTWKKDHPARIISGEKDAVAGVVRFQRSF